MTLDATVRPNTVYKLNRVPLGEGTFSQVFTAEHRTSGEVVALKRARPNPQARGRIQNEIKAQQLLAPHPNIMPIFDHDPGYQWYTMPIARGTLRALRKDLDEEDLFLIIANLADVLEDAHLRDMVHRDISPMNILALDDTSANRRRWVLADWGMVQRPYNSASPRLTRTGAGAGTPGFDAPELVNDARNATAAVDVYGLGRVAAWFLTRQWPASGHPLLPEGPALRWRIFVKACTEHSLEDRITTMSGLRSALTEVHTLHDEPPATRTKRLLDDLLKGETTLEDLVSMALAYPEDPVIYIDLLARAPTVQIRRWVPSSVALAAQAAQRMADHLQSSPWQDRDRQYAATPLMFIFTILQALVDSRQFGLAQDVATGYFAADAFWGHQLQRSRTIQWLSDLKAPADAAIARALVSQPHFTDYYRSNILPKSLALSAIFGS